MRRLAPLMLLLVAGCTAVPKPSAEPPSGPVGSRPPLVQVPPGRPVAPPAAGFRAPQLLSGAGFEGVIQADAGALTRQFGSPRMDMREGDMRKLQFSGQACVLDVFLYPLRQGGEPVATWLEARRESDGQPVDRAACVAALRR